MSKTHKDEPLGVRVAREPQLGAVAHADACASLGGGEPCDAPEEVDIFLFGKGASPATRCFWTLDWEKIHGTEFYRAMPSHGCDHPRCTACTAKRTQKRQARRAGERILRDEIALWRSEA